MHDKLDLQNLIGVLDEQYAQKTGEDAADRILNLARRRKSIAETLVSDANVSDEAALSAVTAYFDNEASFHQPERNLSYLASRIYVARGRIARTIAPYAVGTALGIIVLVGGAQVLSSIAADREISEAKSEVSAVCIKIRESATEISRFDASIDRRLQGFLENDVREAEKTLQGRLVPFQNAYCNSDPVNRANLHTAISDTVSAKIALSSLETTLVDARFLIEKDTWAKEAKPNLDFLIGEIRMHNPPPSLLQAAETAYSNGISAAEGLRMPEGQKYQAELAGISADVEKFSFLSSQLDQLYSSVKSIAREDSASDQANSFYSKGRAYVDSVDVSNLSQQVDGLKDIEGALKSEYKLRVVNQAGVKSGIDRYFTDKSGKRVSGYYLIVEAVDSYGRVLELTVTSQEDYTLAKVKMWGEQVPKEVYDAVAADKKDDGIIQNNFYAVKEAGFLEPRVRMGDSRERMGQITQWKK